MRAVHSDAAGPVAAISQGAGFMIQHRSNAAIVLPGLAYAGIVFAIGFVLGTIRVLVLAPRLGETIAVFVEMPIILTASYFLARWVVQRWQVERTLTARLAMGLAAFAFLMVCELIVSLALFGNTLTGHIAGYARPQAWPGLASQVFFAAIPALLLLRSD